MKLFKSNIILFNLLSILLMGCDAPPSPRRTEASVNSSGQSQVYASGTNYYDNGTTNQDNSTGNITIPEGARQCQWSLDGSANFQYSSSHIGSYNICHDQSDDKIVYIQLKTAISGNRLCFYPLHYQNDQSTYIGSAQCILVTDNKIKQITFAKDRSGFSSLTVNGSMIMKDERHFFSYPYNGNWLTTEAYMRCNQYLQLGYPDFCNAFKQVNAYTIYKF